MKKIILIVVTALVVSCSSNEPCDENCYTIMSVENLNRDCGLSGCLYAFGVELQNNCSGVVENYRTRFINLNQMPQVGEQVCSTFGLIKQ